MGESSKKNKEHVAEFRKRQGMINAILIIAEGNLDDKSKVEAIKELAKSTHKTGGKE